MAGWFNQAEFVIDFEFFGQVDDFVRNIAMFANSLKTLLTYASNLRDRRKIQQRVMIATINPL